jgi:hypothetical protein
LVFCVSKVSCKFEIPLRFGVKEVEIFKVFRSPKVR